MTAELKNHIFNNTILDQSHVESDFLKSLNDCKKIFCKKNASTAVKYKILIDCLDHFLNFSSYYLKRNEQNKLLIKHKQLNKFLKWLERLQHHFNSMSRHPNNDKCAGEYLRKYNNLKNLILKIKILLIEKNNVEQEKINVKKKSNEYEKRVSEIIKKQIDLVQLMKDTEQQKKNLLIMMTVIPALTTVMGITGSVISIVTMGASVPAMLIAAGSVAASLVTITTSVILLLRNLNKLMLTLDNGFREKNAEIINRLQGDFSSLELSQLHQLLADINDASGKISKHLCHGLSQVNYLNQQCRRRQRQLNDRAGGYEEEINGVCTDIIAMSGTSAQTNLLAI